MTGKIYHAGNIMINDCDCIREKKVFVVSANNTVNLKQEYKYFNYICIPGKEVFILINVKTGKQKRAKKIFCCQ